MEVKANSRPAPSNPEASGDDREWDYSSPLDIHIWSDHPDVEAFVEPIYKAYFQGRKGDIRRKHLKVVLLNLYVLWAEDPDRLLAVPRSNNAYQARSIYNELGISSLVVEVVDILKEVGLAEDKDGFFDRRTKKGRRSRLWPTSKLIQMFSEARFSLLDIYPARERVTVILRKTEPAELEGEKGRFEKVDLPYEASSKTEVMSAVLLAYNQLLRRTFIDIPTLENPRIELEAEAGKNWLTISLRDKFVRRVFNRGSWDCGGRFYGGWWQRCPKKWRSKIFIDDHPTNEIDFSGLHVVMLYAQQGINYWEAIGEDPYFVGEFDFLDEGVDARSVAKGLMLMLLNAKTPTKAYKAFRSEQPSRSPLKSLKDDQLGQIHQALADRHSPIAEFFGNDVGISLMNRDGRITEFIIRKLTERAIPVLTMHDSYIVPAGCEDLLIQTMDEAFKEEMGLPLLNPEKAMKEVSERVEVLEGILLSFYPYETKEDAQSFMDRCYPNKTKRYHNNLSLFKSYLSRIQEDTDNNP